MAALFDLEDKENKEIQSFSEAPATPVKPKDVTDAEDEIKETEDDDKSDDKEYREEHSDEDTTDDTDLSTDTSAETAETSDATEADEASDESEEPVTGESVDKDVNATEEDDDKDKSKLAKMFANMTVKEILNYRMITLEYGTQAGTADPGCSGCARGTADAADAVIIDSEVEPAEPTEKDDTAGDTSDSAGMGGDMGGGDFSDATGGDTGGGDTSGGAGGGDTAPPDMGSMSFYDKLSSVYGDYIPRRHTRFNVGLEEYVPTLHDPTSIDYGIGGFFKDIGSVLGRAGNLVASGIKAAVPVIKLCFNRLGVATKRAAKCLATTNMLAKFYRWKLKKYLSYINEEKLKTMKVEAFPGKIWHAICANCAAIGKTLDGADVSGMNEGSYKKLKATLIAQFKKIGVNVEEKKDLAKFAGLNKSRRAGYIYDMGYGPTNIVNYFTEISQLADIAQDSKTKRFVEFFRNVKDRVKNLVSKNEKGSEVIIARTSFILSCREHLITVCNLLADDLKNVANAYDVCMQTEQGDREKDKADGVED